MKKFIFIAAAAAAVLAGCAKNEVTPNYGMMDAVSFGAYTPRTITKAGKTDDMNLDALKTIGFGVFATYSATNDFSEATNDFMNNQLVKFEGSAWTYSPIKYWPNPTNGQTADDQKVSFFAYAPYCEPGASETTGITGFEIDGTSKHNLVHYAFTNDGKPNVDLMWGYKTGSDPKAANLNLTRTAETVKFTFRHLLAKLGGSQEGIQDPTNPSYVANGLTIEANPTADPTQEYGVVNGADPDFGGNKGTKITVSKITVESAPADGVLKDANNNIVSYPDPSDPNSIQKGTLDLYTGVFTLDGGATPQAVQFKQELSADAAEIAAGASELRDDLKEVPGLTDFSAIQKGVTKKTVNVYKDESNPIILVPGTAPVVNVTITYVVRTYDEKLPKGFSEVPQTVFGQVKFPTIEANKKYNLRIKLGLNDVKFEASVEDWTDGGTWNDANGNGVVDPGEVTTGATIIDLPENV